MKNKVALFYAPKGGKVDCISRIITDKAKKYQVDRMCITEVSADKIIEYDKVLFGCSTVNSSAKLLDEPWGNFIGDLKKINLTGKKVAIFGLGDAKAYPTHFADSIGDMADVLMSLDAKICGKVKEDGYFFEQSRAFRDDMFLGLPLDEDNESEKSEGRIDCWLEQLRKEF